MRGELYLRAEQLRKQGKEIIFTNVGNPHALGAKPLTFIRQVRARARLEGRCGHAWWAGSRSSCPALARPITHRCSP